MDDGQWLPLADASRALGQSVDALRHRVRKGELDSRKGNDGRVLVLVSGAPVASGSPPEASAELALLREHVEELTSRASRAEGELAGVREALVRADASLAQARTDLAEIRRELAEARKGWLERLLEAVRRRP
jgi:hypothetical protein